MAADYTWWPFFHLKQYPKLGHVVTHNDLLNAVR